jgi:hypothetical protein
MEEIRFVGDLQRVQPQPGDVFVLTCDQNLSCHQAELLREAFARAMPTATLLILDAGMKLGVIGQPPEVRTTMNVRIEQPAAIDSAGGGFSVGGIDIGAGDDSAIGWFANGVVSPGIDEDWREKCKPKFGNALDFKMPPRLARHRRRRDRRPAGLRLPDTGGLQGQVRSIQEVRAQPTRTAGSEDHPARCRSSQPAARNGAAAMTRSAS